MTADLQLEPLRAADARDLAHLHQRAFPGFFLSTLGPGFLAEFYRGFVGDESAVTVVARDQGGQLCGAVVGTTEPAGFFGRLVRRRLIGFAWASVRAVVRHPSAAPRLLRAVRYRGDAPTEAQGALLSSICVEPATQGKGVGARMLADWLRQVDERGTTDAYLTTDAVGNDAVNAFYQRQGWSVRDTHTTPEGRAMHRYVIHLDGQTC